MLTDRWPIAIDLSDEAAVFALQLTSRRGAPALRAAARRDLSVAETPAARAEAIEAFIRDVRRSRSFRGRSVALLTEPGVVLSHPLRIDVTNGKAFESALVEQAPKALALPFDDLMLDYASAVPVEPRETSRIRQALVVTSRRSVVMPYLELVTRAGGVLELIDSSACALTRVHALSGERGPKPAILCNVGRRRTALVVASGDAILAHRDIPWGTELITRKLVVNLTLDPAGQQAAHLLRMHGVRGTTNPEAGEAAAPQGDEISRTVGQLVAPVVDELLHELHNLTSYVRSSLPNTSFGGFYLYGAGTAIAGLSEHLGRELNLEAKAMDPLAEIGRRARADQPAMEESSGYALALGLALRRTRWL